MNPVADPPKISDPEEIASALEDRSAEQAIEWMFETFGESHYIACSFQKTSSVTAHMAARINPRARFFYLDTDVLFPETYETRDRLAKALGVEFDRFHNLTLEEQAAKYGDELWKSDPDACCGLRKVQPLTRALADVDAWIAGVRRDQGASRAKTPKLAWDARHERWKANPLADWTERDVWRYIADNDLPYNPLHDQGYSSIGCTHCTQPGVGREGRWAGSGKVECGLHA